MKVKEMIEHLQQVDPEAYLRFEVKGKTLEMSVGKSLIPLKFNPRESKDELLFTTRYFSPTIVDGHIGYPPEAAEVDRFSCQCDKPHVVTMIDEVWYPKGTKVCGKCNKKINP